MANPAEKKATSLKTSFRGQPNVHNEITDNSE